MSGLLIGSISASRNAAVGNATFYTVTVPAANLSADLTGFPLRIDLRDMPADFWASVDAGGGNLRAYQSDGISLLPHDLVAIDKTAQTGLLFVKTDLSSVSDTIIVLGLLAPGTAALPVTDPSGRNAVWSEYEAVIVAPEIADRTGKNPVATAGDVAVHPFKETARGAHINMHQGVAFDGTYFYVTDTNIIKKFDTTWNLLATNADPAGVVNTATGLTTLNHCGDPEIVGGELFVPVEEYPSSSYTTQFMAVFNVADLTLNRVIDISAAGREASSISLGPGGNLYVTDYTDGASIPYFDQSGNLLGTLTLSQPIPQIQGITYMGGKFYLTDDSAAKLIWEVETDGTVVREVYKSFYSGFLEGITNDGTNLLVLNDGAFSGIRTITPITGKEEWFRSHGGLMNVDNLPGSTIWTMAATFEPTLELVQGGILSLTSGTERATLVSDNSPLRMTGWNNTDGWMPNGTVTPTAFNTYHVAKSHNGTTERRVWVDGAVNATDAPIAAKMSGANMNWYVSRSNGTSEPQYGHIGMATLVFSVRSDAWIAAEAANYKPGNSFYSVA